MTEFDRWAPFYDLTHLGLSGEDTFYVGNAVRSGGPVLELGAGTGRLAIPMAMSGVRVAALDNATAMLRELQEKRSCLGPIPGRVWPIAGDMRDFALAQSFALIVAAYRTLMHLRNEEERRACLACITRHLAPGGRFMANVWRPSPRRIAELAEAHAHWQVAGVYPDGEGHTLTHRFRADYDQADRRMAEAHEFVMRNAHGELLWEERVPLTRFWCEPSLLRMLMEEAGLVVEAVFRDFDCTPWQEDAEETVFVCRRD